MVVRDRIAVAATRSGRTPADVRLVAVTKRVSAPVAQHLVELGVLDLGENYSQELLRKAAEVHGAVVWHLIGHLQRNKVARTLPLVGLVHSIDSIRLAESVHAAATARGVRASVLLQVNVSREASKHGFAVADLPAALDQMARLHGLTVHGLMTMAAEEANPERCRPTFAELRECRNRLAPVAPPNCPLTELSMGMSNDFEVAIEEGATIVRIGSALFAGAGIAE